MQKPQFEYCDLLSIGVGSFFDSGAHSRTTGKCMRTVTTYVCVFVWGGGGGGGVKLVKMWPGGTLHVVVGTLKISLDQLKKKKQRSFSRVL